MKSRINKKPVELKFRGHAYFISFLGKRSSYGWVPLMLLLLLAVLFLLGGVL